MADAPQTERLPGPDARPHAAAVVIYDGQCVFCRANVRQIVRLDRKQRLAYLSLHESEQVARIAPELTHEQMMEQLYVVTPDGQTFGGAAALRFLSRRLPLLWPLAPLLHIPFSLPLWQWGYRIVARQRYRIAGKHTECDDACSVHGKL